MGKKNYILCLVAGVAMAGVLGCQDVYENKDLSANELIPVVNATIYSDSTNKFVDLAFAKSLYGIYNNSISDAMVQLSDGAGNEYFFSPASNKGQYMLKDQNFKPAVGQSYILKITLPDGEEIVSNPQLIPNALPIVNLSIDQFATRIVESKESGKTVFNTENGLGIYARVALSGSETLYCRFGGDYITYTTDDVSGEPTKFFELNNPDDITDTTWFNVFGHIHRDIYSATQTMDFPAMRIFKKGVTYSDAEQTLLCCFFDKSVVKNAICTYVFCDVISMNSDTYDFYESAESQLTETFRIYDPVPSQLPSNMYNLTDPSKSVLGLFEASARTTRVLKIVYDPGFDSYHISDVTGQIIPEIDDYLSRSSKTFTTITYDTVQLNNLPQPDSTLTDSSQSGWALNRFFGPHKNSDLK